MPNTSRLLIEKRSGMVPVNFRELWDYRELFLFLVWRTIVVRYKQTLIGVLWAVVRPLCTMVIFSVIFGKLARMPSGGIPYPLLTLSALLPWQFFANSLSESSNSLIANSSMISKVYFPRLVIPIASVLSGVVDFLIALGIMAGMMVWYGTVPDVRIVLLPLFFGLAFCSALGIGLWFSALNVKFRDVKYVVPFIVQMGLYVSPVGFSSEVIPERWRMLYACNPMVGVIEGFRWSITGATPAMLKESLLLSSGIILIILVSGAFYFRKMEKTFADII